MENLLIVDGHSAIFGMEDLRELHQGPKRHIARLELIKRLREIGAVRDRALDDEITPLGQRVADALRDRSRSDAQLRNLRRMWEEIEISRFAPKLPRAFPASERRLEQLLDEFARD